METPQLRLYLRLFHADWLSPVRFSRLLGHASTLDHVFSADDLLLASYGLTQI